MQLKTVCTISKRKFASFTVCPIRNPQPDQRPITTEMQNSLPVHNSDTDTEQDSRLYLSVKARQCQPCQPPTFITRYELSKSISVMLSFEKQPAQLDFLLQKLTMEIMCAVPSLCLNPGLLKSQPQPGTSMCPA
jgi:hypothetical protein